MLRESDGDRFVWTFPICDVAAGRMSDDNSRVGTSQHTFHTSDLEIMIFFCLVLFFYPSA